MTKSYKTTLALSVLTATAIAFVLGPALMQSAAADRAPKEETSCSDDKFDELPSCPGKSESAQGGDRDDECTPRNQGQIKECPTGTVVQDPVNPPNK